MADNNRMRDPKLIQEFAQDCCLELRRAAIAGFAFAPTHAGPIDQNDAVTRGQSLAERPHVFEIAARAMNENYWRRIGRRRSELDNVLA
jgi:hypothetical protein